MGVSALRWLSSDTYLAPSEAHANKKLPTVAIAIRPPLFKCDVWLACRYLRGVLMETDQDEPQPE